MKCYPCGFEGVKDDFGTLEASGHGWTSLIGRMPKQHVGSVEVYVCPQCGALHTDMRGEIQDKDRKA
jgi:hypothetical protein